MTERRKRGQGTIETRRLADGRVEYRARVPSGVANKKLSGEWRDSEKKANRDRVALLQLITTGEFAPVETVTFGEDILAWLDSLDAVRSPSAGVYRSRCERHILGTWLTQKPTLKIRRSDIRRFMEEKRKTTVQKHGVLKPMSFGTLRAILAALSSCFTHRMQFNDLITANPCLNLKLETPEVQQERAAEWMRPEVQAAVWSCPQIPLADRLFIQFAVGSGLRIGEQIHMPLSDLREAVATGQLFVRYGSKGRKPKGGKTRTIPLLALARDAAERWLEILPSFCPDNPDLLAFPTPSGTHRSRKAPVGIVVAGKTSGGNDRFQTRWNLYQQLAGIKRHMTHHDWRHTCGASLVSGWWGRRWKLDEVRDFLGHKNVSTTERYYGHLDKSALAQAAQETSGGVPDRSVLTVPTVPSRRHKATETTADSVTGAGTAPFVANTAKTGTYVRESVHGTDRGLIAGFGRGPMLAHARPGRPLRWTAAGRARLASGSTRKGGAR